MSKILFNLSGKIDTDTVDVLRNLKEVADSLSIPFFVVGATARDFILEHCYGISPRRMTIDVDIGVEVADWDQYNNLCTALLATEHFKESTEAQRIFYNDRAIDIIPFGSVADADHNISWPPEHEILMSMLGFDEAYASAVTVRINSDPVLDIKLPTLAGLAILKLIARSETYPLRQKDAEDLHLIMLNYDHTANTARLFEQAPKLMEDSGFDTTKAAVRLLGRNMAANANENTFTKLQTILLKETEESSTYRLIRNMIQGAVEYDDNFDKTLNLLKKLREGLFEGRQG
ncbi:nucleotidyl transferase AbiEii/AbiGii toxin family protein [bacterium]|nr:nucleotidyl transferase AbiEii/AbiGii toxin family protein [bacterium]